MIELRNQFSPKVVLLPSMNDTHQDHSVITQEGFRAFKNSTMLGYEMPWNNLSFVTSCFTVLTKQQLEKKIQAVECYKSQGHKSYASRSFVESLAKVRGVQINREYAEAFELIRLIVE